MGILIPFIKGEPFRKVTFTFSFHGSFPGSLKRRVKRSFEEWDSTLLPEEEASGPTWNKEGNEVVIVLLTRKSEDHLRRVESMLLSSFSSIHPIEDHFKVVRTLDEED